MCKKKQTDRQSWITTIAASLLALAGAYVGSYIGRDATVRAAVEAANATKHSADTAAAAAQRIEIDRDNNEINQKRIQLEADVILKAIQSPNQDDAVKSLKFFANIGLIPDFEAKVRVISTTKNGAGVPYAVPATPPASTSPAPSPTATHGIPFEDSILAGPDRYETFVALWPYSRGTLSTTPPSREEWLKAAKALNYDQIPSFHTEGGRPFVMERNSAIGVEIARERQRAP